MGVGGIGIWQLLIILLIVVMLFGTKKLRNLGSDLGGALKGFKSAMKDDEKEDPEKMQRIQRSLKAKLSKQLQRKWRLSNKKFLSPKCFRGARSLSGILCLIFIQPKYC